MNEEAQRKHAPGGSQESGQLMLLYIPCPDMGTAKELAAAAVSERLAACANILPTMVSVYRWQGAIEDEEETVLILKTPPEREAELRRLIEARHPYDVPAILTLAAVRVNTPYLEWAQAETA
ncbi:periplasmic divalent cation tolerance protein [Rhodopseudomonas julia]|uniref:Periplasmic divalent cation tolerance protein n=1 Tax=Rhodopseudomonas julia TaxID=200617 RepID=A0ABU0CB95_9BRAD|nr:divalent-cation tolerance protein CutA [Rhodopseudomonas julia]MDQ0326885.1 periplasmic divalent cation tolerance protein [Rhodopseudomonas julia]